MTAPKKIIVMKSKRVPREPLCDICQKYPADTQPIRRLGGLRYCKRGCLWRVKRFVMLMKASRQQRKKEQ